MPRNPQEIPKKSHRLRPGEAGRPQRHGQFGVVQAPEAAAAVGGALHGEGQQPGKCQPQRSQRLMNGEFVRVNGYQWFGVAIF